MASAGWALVVVFMQSPRILVEQGADESFGFFGYLFKALLIELPLGSCDQSQGLCITVALEWRLAAQSEKPQKARGIKEEKHSSIMTNGFLHLASSSIKVASSVLGRYFDELWDVFICKVLPAVTDFCHLREVKRTTALLTCCLCTCPAVNGD